LNIKRSGFHGKGFPETGGYGIGLIILYTEPYED